MRRLLWMAILLFSLSSYAQESAANMKMRVPYQEGLRAFRDGNYGLAQQIFETYLSQNTDAKSDLRIQAEYFSAVCALELFHADGEQRVLDFVAAHPAHPRVHQLNLYMAQHQFDRRRYRSARDWYGRLLLQKLPKKVQNEVMFKRGYCAFVSDDFDEALTDFNKVAAAPNAYQNSAIYYQSHMYYTQQAFASALNGFQRLVSDPMYGGIVPYYILEINFQLARYAEVLSEGEKMLSNPNVQRKPELLRMMGESAWFLEDAPRAVTYYDAYRATGARLTTNDYYQFGLAYAAVDSCEGAIAMFNKIVGRGDSMAQDAYYQLAGCYLELGQKSESFNAYSSAAGMPYNARIVELSRFNAAKIAYEIGGIGVNPASLLRNYLKDFPESEFYNEAARYLVDVYLKMKNYGLALESLESLPMDDPKLALAHQRVAFYTGVERYENRLWVDAIAMFNRSQKYRNDPVLFSRAQFWEAEAMYNLKRYEEALMLYTDLLSSGADLSYPEKNQLLYATAYTYFQLKDYQRAATYFERYGQSSTNDERRRTDAVLREADCFFATKGFIRAKRLYGQIAEKALPESAYAFFQQSLCDRLMDRPEDQMRTLNAFIERYPDSPYMDDALFELAQAQFSTGAYSDAIGTFTRLLEDYPQSFYAPRSSMQIALAHYNSNNLDASMEVIQRVVTAYPNTDQGLQAVELAQQIYTERGDISGYAQWVKGLDFASLRTGEIDTLAYEVAYNQYATSEFAKARTYFEDYLREFPKGLFATPATYYAADCAYRLEDYSAALTRYREVLALRPHAYEERALVRASYLTYKLGEWAEAQGYYRQLEQVGQYASNVAMAIIGQMRTAFKLENYAEALEYSNKVLELEEQTSSIVAESWMIQGRSALSLGNDSVARVAFEWVEGNAENAYRAEAKYRLAKGLTADGDYAASSSKVFDLIQNYPSYVQWGQRALVILAQNYWETDDYFQANYTLDRLLEQALDAEIAAEATALRTRIEMERAARERRDSLEQLELETTLQLDSIGMDNQNEE